MVQAQKRCWFAQAPERNGYFLGQVKIPCQQVISFSAGNGFQMSKTSLQVTQQGMRKHSLTFRDFGNDQNQTVFAHPNGVPALKAQQGILIRRAT